MKSTAMEQQRADNGYILLSDGVTAIPAVLMEGVWRSLNSDKIKSVPCGFDPMMTADCAALVRTKVLCR